MKQMQKLVGETNSTKTKGGEKNGDICRNRCYPSTSGLE